MKVLAVIGVVSLAMLTGAVIFVIGVGIFAASHPPVELPPTVSGIPILVEDTGLPLLERPMHSDEGDFPQ